MRDFAGHDPFHRDAQRHPRRFDSFGPFRTGRNTCQAARGIQSRGRDNHRGKWITQPELYEFPGFESQFFGQFSSGSRLG